MIIATCFKDKNIALFGLGDSGIATAKALILGGANLVAFDDNQKSIERAKAKDIPIEDLKNIDWKKFDSFILAPGVPLTHPAPHWSVKLAKAANVEIIGDVEIFIRERNHFLQKNDFCEKDVPFIAITGTNGKSTTTALIAHLLEKAGQDVQMGGNIGKAILSLDALELSRYYVIECSSFQIDLTPSIRPTVGILLNLTPDHIDRHGSFENYALIKQRLVENANTALIAIDDEKSLEIYHKLHAKKTHILAVSKENAVKESGYFAKGGNLYSIQNGEEVFRLSLDGIESLRGRHNAQNALMALGTLDAFDVHLEDIQNAFATYNGLPHRMQQVGKINKVLFINDSKATNAEASAPALASFEHIYWILGGLAKEGGIESLRDYFPKIKKAYLIGKAAEDFAKTIGHAFPISLSKTLEHAVREAAKDAAHDRAEEVAVLLSPACASYDQFKNYADRGDAFKLLVKQLESV